MSALQHPSVHIEHAGCWCTLRHCHELACNRDSGGVTNHVSLCLQPCDLRYMARCCQNLTHFGAESVAVKSYIAMMPLFAKTDALHTPMPWTVNAQLEARTYALQQALQELLDVIVHEKAVFSRVFQKWQVCTAQYAGQAPCWCSCVQFVNMTTERTQRACTFFCAWHVPGARCGHQA